MFKYISNVVTGTFAHWTETNNAAINDLYSKFNILDSFSADIFNKLLAFSSIVADNLLGPSRLKVSSNINRSEIKSLTKSDFDLFYKGLMKMYTYLYVTLNSSEQIIIKDGYEKIFKEPVIITISPASEDIIKNIIFDGLANATSHMKFLNAIDPVRDYALFVIATSTYNSVMIHAQR